ncbi:MAG: HTTM domain-containing protein [Haloechinothrix sp.]
MAATQIRANGAFTVLLWSESDAWFEFAYLFAIVASVMLLVGWRTRTASVLFMIAVLSVQNRNGFIDDGGDNVFHLMAIYLVPIRCGQVWSLDARLARRGGAGPDSVGIVLWSILGAAILVASASGHLSWAWALIFAALWLAHGLSWTVRRYTTGEPRTVCDMLANLAHNGGLFVIVAQLCVLYASAGWYKIQGTRWQDGTAAYYPMHVDAFTPWPVLSDALSSYALPILLMTYGTVIVQVAFPFTLFHRQLKNVLLALLIAEHAGIAVLLGLPFFSLAIIAADLIFLPTSFMRRVDRKVSRLLRRSAPPEPAAGERPKELAHT